LDITLATPLEGVKRLKGTGTFDTKRQRIAFKVSFLDGGGESVKVRGAGARGNRCSFAVKYEDASQWRAEGESGDAFIRAFTETAEAQARDTFAAFVSKAKRARSPSIGAEDDDVPDAKRTRSSSIGAKNDDAPEEAHVPSESYGGEHDDASEEAHVPSETYGGAGSSSSSSRDFSVQAAEVPDDAAVGGGAASLVAAPNESKRQRSTVDRLSVTEKQFGYAGVRDGRHTKAARKSAEPEEHARLSAALDVMEAAQAPGSAHAGTAAAAAKALELMGEQNKVLNEENGALKEEIQSVKESLKGHLAMVQAILDEGGGAEEVEGEGDARLLRHNEHEALKLLQGVMLELLDSLPEAEEAAMVAHIRVLG